MGYTVDPALFRVRRSKYSNLKKSCFPSGQWLTYVTRRGRATLHRVGNLSVRRQTPVRFDHTSSAWVLLLESKSATSPTIAGVSDQS